MSGASTLHLNARGLEKYTRCPNLSHARSVGTRLSNEQMDCSTSVNYKPRSRLRGFTTKHVCDGTTKDGIVVPGQIFLFTTIQSLDVPPPCYDTNQMGPTQCQLAWPITKLERALEG